MCPRDTRRNNLPVRVILWNVLRKYGILGSDYFLPDPFGSSVDVSERPKISKYQKITGDSKVRKCYGFDSSLAANLKLFTHCSPN
jgi:hypothetical protein